MIVVNYQYHKEDQTMSEFDYRSAVNPTFFTAQQTAFMLAAAGNEDAKKVIAELGLQNNLQQNNDRSPQQKAFLSSEEGKALTTGVIIAIEARYAAISNAVKSGGFGNMLDIACGFTPRSVFCRRENIDYVGADVPVVAEQLGALDKNLLSGKAHSSYLGVDATNSASLMAAADLMEGEIFISSEGLMGYFSKDELLQFLGGIRDVLRKHGGAWFTTDPGVKYDDFATILMKDPDAKAKYEEGRKQTMKASNIYNQVSGIEGEALVDFIKAHGFRVEKLPFCQNGDSLMMMNAVPQDMKDKLYALLDSSALYKFTLDPDYTVADTIRGASEVENLRIGFTLNDGVLSFIPEGRIDTISAPSLLKLFEENAPNGAETVMIDAQKLEYISSAGLRVLMMMVKKLGEGSVTVINASSAVKEIFETTGFDQMIVIK